MTFSDLYRLASGNLLRNRTRSAMTLVGVAIGVAALYALLSYGSGLQRVADDEFATLELYNTLRVTSTPNPIESFADVSARTLDPARMDTVDLVPLTDSVLAAVEALPGVLAAYPEITFPVRVRHDGREVFAGAEAIPMSFETIPAYRPAVGSFFETPADTAMLIPRSMAERLGFEPAESAVGESITVLTATLDYAKLQRALFSFGTGLRTLPIKEERHALRVAGLLPEEGQALTGFVRLLVPLDLAASLQKVTFFSTLDLVSRGPDLGGYTAARVQLRSEDDYGAVKSAIEAEGLFATGFREQFAQLDRLFAILNGTLAIVGLIALIVATIGIANTMMMNVMERTREIGVMKAIGGEDADVQRLFVMESLLLGVAGGVLGLAFGWLVTEGLSAGVVAYLDRIGVPPLDVFHTPPLLIAGIVAVTLVVSVLAGFAPARRAARVEPIAALRHV
jgi:putative ABC transport system permease protein